MRAGFFIALIFVGLQYTYAQQAVSPVEQARLFKKLPVSANGTLEADDDAPATADDESTSDGSFGKQVILQRPPPTRPFVITGDTSIFYTNNAALTRNHRIDDAFFVSNAAVSWTRQINPRLETHFAAHGSIFRYDKTSALDFQSLGFNAGLFWNPDHFAGVGFFANYDFIELIDRHSEEILRDHEFAIGAQKIFPLGRTHAVVLGTSIMAGIATPDSEERDQAGVFLAYRLQATRSLGLEFLYRFAGYFYSHPGRTDRNQLLSISARYQFLEWADIHAFFSFADNRSDHSVFDYDAFTGGGGLGATVRF